MSPGDARDARDAEARQSGNIPRWGPKEWIWFISKNVIGWLLMILAWPIGIAVPGPGGLPIFLIGFALVTFPGKRHLTARVMRGIPVNRHSTAFRVTIVIIAVLLPIIALAYLRFKRWENVFEYISRPQLLMTMLYFCSVAVLVILGLRSDRLINWILRNIPRVRRKVRPWLRRKGMDLLPPRRRRRKHTSGPDDEILEIHQRHHDRIVATWTFLRTWGQRILGVVITIAIFYWMFRPVYLHWDKVKEPLSRLNWFLFALGAVMFALFLFIFRVLPWCWVLFRFGHRLPLPAATRIWSLSELARYLPGKVWQFIGRVFLIRPYGVSASVCTTSQILEMTVFLLANLLVALACLVWLGIKKEPQLRPFLYAAMALVPLLLLFLHPKIFYGIFDWVIKKLRQPVIEQHLRKRELLGVGIWAIVGLIWQSLAIWIVIQDPLELQFTKWWVVAGAYCLAWCAGFLAFWAPAGLGVREAVFMVAMRVALPQAVLDRFSDPAVLAGFLAFLAVLLRLLVTSGELLLAAIAYTADFRRKGLTAATEMPLKSIENPPPAADPASL
jgi:hypothetical protein